MRRYTPVVVVITLLGLGLWGVASAQAPTQQTFLPFVVSNPLTPIATNTPTPTSTNTTIPTATNTPTSTNTATPSPTMTNTPTATPTNTPTATNTAVPPTATNTPSATSTNTATPSPTAVPPTATKTPTPMVGKLTIVMDTLYSYHNGTYRHVMGEVRNDSTTNARFVRIDAAFSDNTSGFTYTKMKVVPPGATTCFEVLAKGTAMTATFKLTTTYMVQSAPTISNISLSNFGVTEDFIKRIQLHGEATNGNPTATNVSVIGTIYNSDDVIHCYTDSLNTSGIDLQPAQTQAFTMTANWTLPISATSYRLQIDNSYTSLTSP